MQELTAELVVFLPRFHDGFHRRRHGKLIRIENGRPILDLVFVRRHHVEERPDARQDMSEQLAEQQRFPDRVRGQAGVRP